MATLLQVILGGFVESFPMSLFHLNLAVILACVAIFCAAVAVGESMLEEDSETTVLLSPSEKRKT